MIIIFCSTASIFVTTDRILTKYNNAQKVKIFLGVTQKRFILSHLSSIDSKTFLGYTLRVFNNCHTGLKTLNILHCQILGPPSRAMFAKRAHIKKK